MIEVKFGMLNEKAFENYLKFLIGQLYKSLCLKEDNSETLLSYLESLNRELIGSKELITILKNDARFISLMCKVQYLISDTEVDHKVFKKEIFSCINLVQKLQKQYGLS
ncbi:MAG TPA: hypothetical protein VIM70_01600 [Clostridium sp.]|uniref:hypothetical protein n=1 Tax=Clostridium sp. TaxID=1506 RepID=UPI002F94C138